MPTQKPYKQYFQENHGNPECSTTNLHTKLIAQRAKKYRELIHRYSSLDPFSNPSVFPRRNQPSSINTTPVPEISKRLANQKSTVGASVVGKRNTGLSQLMATKKP